MSKVKPLSILAGAAILSLALSGCTSSGDAPDAAGSDSLRIAYLAAFTNHDWAQVGISAAQTMAADMGAQMEVFDAQSDPSKQYAQVQDIITTGRFDGIVIMPVDGASIVPVIEEAVEAGLSVADVAFPVGTDLTTRDSQVEGMAGSVVISPAQNGATLANMAKEACVGVQDCEVAVLPGSLTVSADAARVKEIDSILSNETAIKIVAMQETGYTTDGAFEQAASILTAHPSVDVFLAIGSESVVGAERAVVDAGLTGKVKLAGGGCSTNATEAIVDGRFFACYRGTPVEDNAAAMELVIKHALGETISDRSPDPSADEWPDIVTKANIGDRVGQWTD